MHTLWAELANKNRDHLKQVSVLVTFPFDTDLLEKCPDDWSISPRNRKFQLEAGRINVCFPQELPGGMSTG